MLIQSAFKNPDYISANELAGRTATLTIATVKIVELEDEKGRKSGRPVVYFREIKRGWVLNRTNAQALTAMFGPETDSWAGARVTLYSAQVQLGRERTLGLRLAGSPDIQKPITFDLKLPRKKVQRVTLKPTPKGEIVVPEEPVEVAEEPAAQPEQEVIP